MFAACRKGGSGPLRQRYGAVICRMSQSEHESTGIVQLRVTQLKCLHKSAS